MKPDRSIPATSAATDGIGALAGLDLPALRTRWRALYRTDPPVRMSRELMLQALAYRIQEQVHGGLSRSARTRLTAVGRGGSSRSNRSVVQRKAKPGTRLLREWQGRTHEVLVTIDGRFEYRGTVYRSLSAVARAITGTRWSGPAFFGLTSKSGV